MDNERQTINQQVAEDKGGISFADIFYVLRSHIILILAITLLFAVGGFIYSKVRKPLYTATVPVQFDVSIKSLDKETNAEDDDQRASTTYLFTYIDTAVGICKSGEVIDRANVYYDAFLKSGKPIDEFMQDLGDAYEAVKLQHGEIPNYEITSENVKACRNKWMSAGNVGTNYTSNSNSADIQVNFELWVKDLNSKDAQEMARVYSFAANVSLNKILVFDKEETGFNGTAGLIDLAGSSRGVAVATDISTAKILIISIALGLAIALATVYIINVSDNTMKSKEQMEEMFGVSVIAYIDKVTEA